MENQDGNLTRLPPPNGDVDIGPPAVIAPPAKAGRPAKITVKEAKKMAVRAGVSNLLQPVRIRGMADYGKFLEQMGTRDYARALIVLSAESLRKCLRNTEKRSSNENASEAGKLAAQNAQVDLVSKLIDCGKALIACEEKSGSANGDVGPVTPSAPPRLNVTIQNLQQSPK